ncbi:AAA family ATPase [Desulfobacterales bacterium HSG16]|nr:AAA family ATPase [Desulfobacterales bacterium HSG16]
MITKVTIENYKSIRKASINLSPFTLLIGANGTGKSNFLQSLREYSKETLKYDLSSKKHINCPSLRQYFKLHNRAGSYSVIDGKSYNKTGSYSEVNRVRYDSKAAECSNVAIFCLNPDNPGKFEELVSDPFVHEDGSGVVQVIDSLKTGDREDLFDKIETTLKQFVPEIEKLSFIPGQNAKQLQVREKHILKPVPVSQLSEGTRLVLILLTIIYQEKPPSMICIEDIDRGLHPRLLGQIVQLCFDMANKENVPQIIATTHNPYFLDQFKGNEEAVIIVEKKKGETTFTTLEERLKHLESEEDDPLGELWYSGFIGGVPKKGF